MFKLIIISVCAPGWLLYTDSANNSNCLNLRWGSWLSWNEANSECQSDSNHFGELASVHDNGTNAFLGWLADGYGNGFWLGGYKNEKGTWSWTDKSNWDYQNWASGEPEDGNHTYTRVEASGVWWDAVQEDTVWDQALCQYKGKGVTAQMLSNSLW